MSVSVVAPLTDSRWDELLARHPRTSVFHSRGWLEALRRTYGHEPFALTTTTNGPLRNGLVLCGVKNWRSRRLISLPFADHCEPLLGRPDDLSDLLAAVARETVSGWWRSFELRPRQAVPGGLAPCARYCLHTLNLMRPSKQVFNGFHPSCMRRAIRRAEREDVSYDAGRSERLLTAFYGLLRVTRRRHALPPPPFAWYHNLAECMGEDLTIHVASVRGVPVAAVLTLSFKNTLVYKSGGSDRRYHHLGAMPYLFWRVIQEAQARGIEEFDLGRSDLDQPGLIAFKDHLGAERTMLTYYNSLPRRAIGGRPGPLARAAQRVVRFLPDAALDLAGRLLYKHLG